MACKPKCKWMGYHYPDSNLPKEQRKKAMRAVEGNDYFKEGVLHPQCNDCKLEEKACEQRNSQILRECQSAGFDFKIKKLDKECEEIIKRLGLKR